MTEPRIDVRKRIAEHVRNHPEQTLVSITGKLCCSLSTLRNIMREHNVVRQSRLSVASLAALEGTDND